MSTDLRLSNRKYFAVSLVAAIVLLISACGDGASETPAQTVGAAPTAQSQQSSGPPTPVLATTAATWTPPTPPVDNVGESWSKVAVPATPAASLDSGPNIDTPVLVNTPGPVAMLAPDFTLPSIEGPEYTLSEYRGKQPVLVVFYRAYW